MKNIFTTGKEKLRSIWPVSAKEREQNWYVIAQAPWQIMTHDASSALAFGRSYTYYIRLEEIEDVQTFKKAVQRSGLSFQESGMEELDGNAPVGDILYISHPDDSWKIGLVVSSPSEALSRGPA